jgi:hypothetical protein
LPVQTISILESGYWRVWIVECGITEDVSQGKILISGSVSIQNPYGYLPGDIAPLLPVRHHQLV